MRGQGRTAMFLGVLLVSLSQAEPPQTTIFSEAERALYDLRAQDPERQRDAVKRFPLHADESLALLASEIPTVAEESTENLPRFLDAFTQTFPRAGEKARVDALGQVLSSSYPSGTRRSYSGEGLEPWLEGTEASTSGRLLVLRLSCSEVTWHGRTALVAYARWAAEIIRDARFTQAQKVTSVRLLLCMAEQGVEGLRAAQPDSTQLLVEVLRSQVSDRYALPVTRVLTDLDPEQTFRLLAAEVRGADLVRRAQALNMLSQLYSTVRPPADMVSLIPDVVREIQSPCSSTFEPSMRLLGLLRIKAAVPALLASLRMPCAEPMQTGVVRALGSIEDPTAAGPLILMLNDRTNSNALRTAVARALGQLPDADAQKASDRFLNPWWRQRRARVWPIVLLILASGPIVTLVRKESLSGGTRTAYCFLSFLAGGWTYAYGDSTLSPPFWLFLAVSLLSWIACIGGQDSPALRVRTADEMATARASISAAAATFALGWASLVAGVAGLLLLLVVAWLTFLL